MVNVTFGLNEYWTGSSTARLLVPVAMGSPAPAKTSEAPVAVPAPPLAGLTDTVAGANVNGLVGESVTDLVASESPTKFADAAERVQGAASPRPSVTVTVPKAPLA